MTLMSNKAVVDLLESAQRIDRYYAHRWPDETVSYVKQLIEKIEDFEMALAWADDHDPQLVEMIRGRIQKIEARAAPSGVCGGEEAARAAPQASASAVPPYLRDL